jgi:Ser/Thr protein kinase RdoA (MazF antagonist)
LLFKGEELQAILDWEQTGVGAAIMDLAASITGLGLLQREGQVKQELYQALLTGYQSERKLQRVEKQNLVKVIQYMGLIESVCVLYKYGIETPNEGKMGWGDYYWYFGLDKLELPEIG